MAKLSAALLLSCAFAFGHAAAAAQNDNRAQEPPPPQCAEPVYPMREVSVKPRILAKPEPRYTEEARRNRVSGRVVVEAVLCTTGKVTDIKVLRGLPSGLSESAMRAARGIRFEPGENDGVAVSVRVRVEYGFETY